MKIIVTSFQGKEIIYKLYLKIYIFYGLRLKTDLPTTYTKTIILLAFAQSCK